MGDHIILPGHAGDEYEMAETEAAGLDIEQAMSFRRMLKAFDPYLDLIWVREGSTNFENPGRWHMVRWHPGGNDELNGYWVVQNPDGSYCPPDDRHLDRLKQIDSHTRNRMEDIRQRRNDRAAAARKAFDDRRAQFREMLDERIRHNHDVRISVPRAIDQDKRTEKLLLGPDGRPFRQKKLEKAPA